MMNMLNVKSTIVDTLLSYFAPHYCCSCGEIGALLCESCKHNIMSEPFTGCVLCGRPIPSTCHHCSPLITRAWCGGERNGGLEALINRFKFEYARAAYAPLGDVLLAALPQLPKETIVVPIPTVRSHVRQRGYDHTFLIAQYIAAKQGLTLARPLVRRTVSVQRGSSRKVRIEQARSAFAVKGSLRAGIPYLLIDDVVTTGSTLRYAAEALHKAGADVIWAGAVARQPLD